MSIPILVLCATAIALPAQTFSTLHSFDGTDGAYPSAGLVQATNGGLYGTTQEGRANNWGAIFRITPGGKLVTLLCLSQMSSSAPRRTNDAN
jgi:uncharacterized repeat protein (TIGR03803 family)